MGLKGKRKGQLLGCGERAVTIGLEDLLTEPFSGETQPQTTLSLPSNLLLDPPIDQT